MKKIIYSILFTAMMAACADSDMIEIIESENPIVTDVPTKPGEEKDLKSTLLIYAVASNNLDYYFPADTTEMVRAAYNINLSQNRVLLYSLTRRDAPTLKELRKGDNGEIHFVTIKNYDRSEYSTDPQRISRVIKDVRALGEGQSNGIVFWSHGTGWKPDYSDHAVAYSYGQDTYNGISDYCDIDELAYAIPDNYFDFIWFDCCYMSGIETLYQLRDKASRIVAYPTEIAADGLPYDLCMPYMVGADPNLVAAADQMADYYNSRYTPYTVAVVDTSVLPEIAQWAGKALHGKLPAKTDLLNYSRLSKPFYDFAQLTSLRGDDSPFWDQAGFDKAMKRLVLYKAAYTSDFNGRPIPADKFSGVSSHYLEFTFTKDDEFYRNLDWWKAIVAYSDSASVPPIYND